MRYDMLWKNKTGKEKGLARSANGSAGLFSLIYGSFNEFSALRWDTGRPGAEAGQRVKDAGPALPCLPETRRPGAEPPGVQARQGAEGCRASSALFAGYRPV